MSSTKTKTAQWKLNSPTKMNTLFVVSCLFAVACAQQGYNKYQQYVTPSARLVQPVHYVQPAVSYAHPAGQYVQTRNLVKPVAILRQSSEFNYDGNFNYDFQSENGITNQAVGSVKAISPKEQAQVMQGSYSYTAPDGTPINTNWYADETGFHVEGAHLPTPPPLPLEIARSLEYIRSLPPSKDNQQ